MANIKVDDTETYYMPVSRELLRQMENKWSRPVLMMSKRTDDGEWTFEMQTLPDKVEVPSDWWTR